MITMRPVGEIRMALSAAAAEFGEAGATWRDLAVAACVGYDAAQATTDNMVRAGDLVVIGRVTRPGVSRPMRLLAAPVVIGEQRDDDAPQAAELQAVVRCWADFR